MTVTADAETLDKLKVSENLIFALRVFIVIIIIVWLALSITTAVLAYKESAVVDPRLSELKQYGKDFWTAVASSVVAFIAGCFYIALFHMDIKITS
jgi:hypothetical protein